MIKYIPHLDPLVALFILAFVLTMVGLYVLAQIIKSIKLDTSFTSRNKTTLSHEMLDPAVKHINSPQ